MSNTLLIMSDEHNPRYSSPYGHRRIGTPNMQALAERGTLFENAYCNSPLCCPSRSAFLTGLYVHQNETYSNTTVNVRRDYPSWGAELARGGIHTVHAGKTDTYAPTAELGFSEVLVAGDRVVPAKQAGKSVTVTNKARGEERASQYGPKEDYDAADAVTMEAGLAWLDKTAPNVGKPWVLSVNLMKPHFPHYVSQELWDLYADMADLPEHRGDAATANHPFAQDLRAYFKTALFTEEQIRGLRRGYYGLVTQLDRQIGQLIDVLRRHNLLDSTNIIYTSDHGEMLGKFDMWWKCCQFEDAARVPVIAAGPDFAKGRRISTPISLMDVQASLFACSGVKMPAGRQGRALQEIPVNDKERVVFGEYHAHGPRAGMYMLRKGDWKLIYCVGVENMLFNLAEDPEELNDLIAQRPDKAAELESHLRGICDPEKESARAKEFQRLQKVEVERRRGMAAATA